MLKRGGRPPVAGPAQPAMAVAGRTAPCERRRAMLHAGASPRRHSSRSAMSPAPAPAAFLMLPCSPTAAGSRPRTGTLSIDRSARSHRPAWQRPSARQQQLVHDLLLELLGAAPLAPRWTRFRARRRRCSAPADVGCFTGARRARHLASSTQQLLPQHQHCPATCSARARRARRQLGATQPADVHGNCGAPQATKRHRVPSRSSSRDEPAAGLRGSECTMR
jgi:hypothetical protein